MYYLFQLRTDVQKMRMLIKELKEADLEKDKKIERLKKKLKKEKQKSFELQNIVNKLHADCYYYENYREPIKEKRVPPREEVNPECPF